MPQEGPESAFRLAARFRNGRRLQRKRPAAVKRSRVYGKLATTAGCQCRKSSTRHPRREPVSGTKPTIGPGRKPESAATLPEEHSAPASPELAEAQPMQSQKPLQHWAV